MIYEEDKEQHQEELMDRFVSCVHSMKKNELRQALLELLFDDPEWQYEQFIRQYPE